MTFVLIFDHPFECQRKFSDLQEAQSCGQKQTTGKDQHHEWDTPHKVIDCC